MTFPTDLRYTKSHEWVRLEGEVATVGITDHAQAELGDVVYLDLPVAGRQVTAGEAVAVGSGPEEPSAVHPASASAPASTRPHVRAPVDRIRRTYPDRPHRDPRRPHRTRGAAPTPSRAFGLRSHYGRPRAGATGRSCRSR